MHLKLKVLMLIAGLLMISQPSLSWAKHLGGSTGHVAPYPASVPAEDIKNTLHNLSTSNPVAGVNIAAGANPTTEVCVFCHTPHGSNPNAPGSAPIWNRTVPASAGYTIYSGPNFDALNSGQPQGVSLACLSCHDGTVALDSLINMPGSGGFRPANLVAPGGTTNLIAPVGGSAFLNGSNQMSGAANRTDTGPNYGTITGGAKPFPNLTTDLSDDHPISMEMPASDPQFTPALTNSIPDPSGSGLTFITRTGTMNLDKRDQIRAYPGALRTPGVGKYIECASCHNPHAPRPLFLRLPSRYDVATALASGGGATTEAGMGVGAGAGLIADNPNAGSLVCLSCHQK
ncbi:MAG: hypothetical protein HY283_07225 [Nitrospirae bacterium]|nr:hypothetical protein [Nitrospirota bacterium]